MVTVPWLLWNRSFLLYKGTALGIAETMCQLNVIKDMFILCIFICGFMNELVGGHKQVNLELFLVFSTWMKERIEMITF